MRRNRSQVPSGGYFLLKYLSRSLTVALLVLWVMYPQHLLTVHILIIG